MGDKKEASSDEDDLSSSYTFKDSMDIKLDQHTEKSNSKDFDQKKQRKMADRKKTKGYRAAVREQRRAIKELQLLVQQLQKEIEKTKSRPKYQERFYDTFRKY